MWLFVILIAWMPFFMGAWDNTLPADSSVWDQAAGFIRNNNNALEVVLGVDLSMEGSASPWYEATAPTTVADASTALAAGNNGLLWVDSDTRILYTYIHGTGFRGIDALPAVVTFTAADATPTVVLSSVFTTDSAGLTITDFDDGTDGKVIHVLSKGAVVYDTTTAQDADHNLDGSSGDITTASGDVTAWRNEGGSTWHLVRWNDASFDNGAQLALNSQLHTSTTGFSPTSYTGGETQTFPTGIIIKVGSATSDTTVTFGVAFPTALISVVVTAGGAGGGASDQSVYVENLAAASFDLSRSGAANVTCYWLAIGH